MNVRKLVGELAVVGYVVMALLTGGSRSRDCAAGSVINPEPDRYGIVGMMVTGAFWPVALLLHVRDNGTVRDFFSRNGFCSPVKRSIAPNGSGQ